MKESPHITGPHGQAWRYDMDAFRKKVNTGRPDSGIASWLVRAPWANIMWHSYALHLIHLRPVPGLAPPKIYLPDATHEMMLFALDPKWELSTLEYPPHLFPINFAAQFIEPTDAQAQERCEKCIIEIVNGQLSPDTDYIQHWRHRFNASMLKGDPDRAGETIIVSQSPDGKVEKLVFDPAALNKPPKT